MKKLSVEENRRLKRRTEDRLEIAPSKRELLETVQREGGKRHEGGRERSLGSHQGGNNSTGREW